jgi:AraC-like DNA-binding protein
MPYRGERPLLRRMVISLSPEILTYLRASPFSPHLLRDPGKSIAEVTQETGFFDQSYFTKVFRKSEGLTPKAFRKNILKPAEK